MDHNYRHKLSVDTCEYSLKVFRVIFVVTLQFSMKTDTVVVWDVKYYGTKCICFVLLLLVLVSDMQATAQSHTETYVIYETGTRSVCVPDRSSFLPDRCRYLSTVESRTATRCQTGWTPYPTCNEFNECTSGTSGCEQICTDTVDSFICSCNAGYRLALNGRLCDDIDECNEKTSNCEQICSNTRGSYTCSCNAGYRLAGNGLSCGDIDECIEGNSGCAQGCDNTVGAYTCRCAVGYRLLSNERSCTDVNECADLVDNCTVPENSICENTIGSYRCVCKTGFEQVGPLAQCRDINECETFANNCTLYENSTCENIIGSYICRSDGLGTSETAASKVVIIVVTICVVVGIVLIVLIVIAVVCFLRRAKERRRNEKDPATSNTDVTSANVYDNMTSDSTPNELENSPSRVSSEIVCDEFNDIKSQVRNTSAPQMEFSEIVYEDFSDVSIPKTKPETKPKTKPKTMPKTMPMPKLDDLDTQEQCCSTNVPCSTPGNGKSDSKEAATGQTISTNIHKGIQRIFKFKKANKDLQSEEATNYSVYQDLAAVPEINGVYEVIRKPPKAKKISA